MKSLRLRFILFCRLLTVAVLFAGAGESLVAQTNPAPQPLPLNLNFGTTGFTVLPPGIAAWNGSNGGSVHTATLAASSAATGDAAVSSATAAQSTGGTYGFASGGNGRLYVQTSNSATNGANQLALAFNTTGQSAIMLDYDVEIISAQPRTVGVVCQYRIGNSGTWTTLVPATGLNPFSQAGGTTGVKTSPHVAIPNIAENQPVVQIRWAVWRGTETGNSSGIAIDNIVASGSFASISLFSVLSVSSVLETAGANATTLTVTRTGDLAASLPVTLLISDATKAAYDGPNPLSIPAGQASVSFPIRAVDDDGSDGTQAVSLQVTAPGATSATTTLSVLDDEDVDSPPAGYYSSAAGLIGIPLKSALKVIASPGNYHAYAYADTYTPLRALWEDPNNSANLITIYSGTSLAKNASFYPGGPSPDVSWSREHVWPDSFGLDPDNVNPGSTGGDAGPDFTDLFNLRPCLQTVNATRGNYYYDETTGTPVVPPLAPQCSHDGDSWEPREVEKGELARTIFYMATRYDGTDANTIDLEVANTSSTTNGRFANLAMLLRWNDEFPITAAERRRNQTIFGTYQRNRNPFIDHPEYVDVVWGNVRLEKINAAVTEGGATDGYTIMLGSQPTADVMVILSINLPAQISVLPASVTFSSANWNQPQFVSVSAVNDTVHEATLTARVLHAVSSSDSRYAALIPLDVTVTVIDDDPVIAPASLPIQYGGPWDSLPSGFLGSGLGSPYAGSLGGDTATGSAKFDSAGDQLTIGFNSAPATVSYQLKGNPSAGTATSGTFTVQQSANGVNFSTVRTIANKDNSDQAFSDVLALGTRYVAFLFTEKIGGNLQLDKLTISAAPLYDSWVSGFGLSGVAADETGDGEKDGYSNLAEYILGGSPVANDVATFQPVAQVVNGKLRLTAVVRVNDPSISIFAETTADLANAATWTVSGVTSLSGVDQSGVAAGFVRVTCETAGGNLRFLRFRFVKG